VQEASGVYGFPVFSIINALDIVNALESSKEKVFLRHASAIRSHLKKFGTLP
jgi:hypothetical protein